jgi:hypothetical protein
LLWADEYGHPETGENLSKTGGKQADKRSFVMYCFCYFMWRKKMRNLLISLLLVVLSGLFFAMFCTGCKTTEQKVTPAAVSKDTTEKAPPAAVSKDTAEKASPKKNVPPTEPLQQENVGHLIADKTAIDFGVVGPKDKVTGKFTLTNDGKDTVEIKKPIRHGCNCVLEVDLKKYTLKPGESSELTFVYTTQETPGPATKVIYIDTNPPAVPRILSLELKANVKELISVKPEKIEFELRPNRELNFTLELKSLADEPFNVTNFQCANNAVTATFDSNIKSTSHKLSVSAEAGKLRGLPNGKITISTNHPKVPSIIVPFSTVFPFVAYPPSQTFLNRMQLDLPQKGVAKIVSNFGENFEIGEVTSQNGGIEVLNKTKTEDGYQIEFAFTIPKDSKQKYFSDYLLINIKDHPQDTVKVQCHGSIRRETTPSTSLQEDTLRQPQRRPRSPVKKDVPLNAPSENDEKVSR